MKFYSLGNKRFETCFSFILVVTSPVFVYEVWPVPVACQWESPSSLIAEFRQRQNSAIKEESDPHRYFTGIRKGGRGLHCVTFIQQQKKVVSLKHVLLQQDTHCN